MKQKNIDKIINKIRTKIWKKDTLTSTEEMFLRNIVSEDIKKNISYYKNSWNIIVADLAQTYTENDFKTYFIIKSQHKHDQDNYSWIQNAIATKHIDAILIEDKASDFIIFESKKIVLSLDIEAQNIFLKKGKIKYKRHYKLDELPMFKSLITKH